MAWFSNFKLDELTAQVQAAATAAQENMTKLAQEVQENFQKEKEKLQEEFSRVNIQVRAT